MYRQLKLGVLFALALVLCVPALAQVPFQDGQRVLFLGDSITQSGQYVSFIETYLWAKYPERDIEVINIGLSSETASGRSEEGHPGKRPWIHDRLDACLEVAEPDWVVVCYGMNDGIYHPPSEDGLAAYQKGITDLVAKVEAAGAKVILLTPPPYDAETQRMRGANLLPLGAEGYGYKTPYEGYDDVLAGYADWIMTQGDAVEEVLSLHQPMRTYIEACREIDSAYRYGDGVHPPLAGHYRMALAFLEGLGEDGHAAHRTLGLVTGQSLFPDEAGPESEFLKSLLQRSRNLSAAYRGHVSPGKRGQNTPALEEAQALATAQEKELRPAVARRTATGVKVKVEE